MSAKPILALMMLLISCGAFAGMMSMKTDVQVRDKQRYQLASEREDLQETVRVLKAELAHLTRPERLRALAEQKGLKPIEMYQIVPLNPVLAAPPSGQGGARG